MAIGFVLCFIISFFGLAKLSFSVDEYHAKDPRVPEWIRSTMSETFSASLAIGFFFAFLMLVTINYQPTDREITMFWSFWAIGFASLAVGFWDYWRAQPYIRPQLSLPL